MKQLWLGASRGRHVRFGDAYQGGLQPGRAFPASVHVGRKLADPEWDKFVAATSGGTYQQTSMWAQVKSVAGWRPVRIALAGDGAVVAGCQVLVRRVARFGAVAYVPYGPLTADGGGGAALSAMLDALQELAREERFLYLKLQPPPGSTDMTGALRERQFVLGGLGWLRAPTRRGRPAASDPSPHVTEPGAGGVLQMT